VSLDPYTLMEEDEEQSKERQRATGVIGNGTMVWCQPNVFDPTIGQVQHRSVCLTRPYASCRTCPHVSFTLVFKSVPEDPYELLACPRWRDGERGRLSKKPPDDYVQVERAFCRSKPFNFCPSCPSSDLLVDIGADKVRPGWYGRWHRFTSEDDDRDG
jgi:hypothetical protein